MLMRGRVPRRQGDTNRKPEPRPIVIKTPQSMYQDCGECLVPSNGSVKFYTVRFPRAGVVSDISVNTEGIPSGANVDVVLMDGESNEILRCPAVGFTTPARHAVPANVQFSLWLSQTDGQEDIMVAADVAYVFQES